MENLLLTVNSSSKSDRMRRDTRPSWYSLLLINLGWRDVQNPLKEFLQCFRTTAFISVLTFGWVKMQTVGSGFDKQTNVDDSDHYQWPWQHKVLLSEPIIDYIEQMRWYCFSIIDHGILCLHSQGLANCDWENSEFSCLPWPASSCLNTSWHWSSFCLRCSPICLVIDAFWWFSYDFWWFFG